MRRLTLLVALVGIVLPVTLLVACTTPEPAAEEPAEIAEQPADAASTEPAAANDPADNVVEDGELPMVNPIEVQGNIVAAGSSTVFPLSEVMADWFTKDGYSGQITIDSIGSGAGFDRFCTAGESDISNASRPIKDEEIENCRAIGREPLEFKLATDAIAVVVSNENDFVADVAIDELAMMFGEAQMWSDIRPDWPDQDILRFAPGTDSGTFDFFVEEVFDKDPAPHLSASSLQQSEDDNVLVQGVQGSPYAVAYFGYAYFDQNRDSLIALGLDGVEASPESVDSGQYALARPLYNYTTAEILNEKPQVAAFLNYYLTYANDAAASVGYFPASADALQASKTLWIEATNP